MTTRRACQTTLLLLAVASGVPAGAQNLLGNGELDTGVEAWSEPLAADTAIGWEADDHGSCEPGSGLGWIFHEISEENTQIVTEQCATGIVPGAEYSLDGWLRFPLGETEDGTGSVDVQWIAAVGHCGGTIIRTDTAGPELFTTTLGLWHHALDDDLVAPESAFSAQVRIVLLKLPAGGGLTLHFDGVHLVRGGGYLFGDDFEVGSDCRWGPLQK